MTVHLTSAAAPADSPFAGGVAATSASSHKEVLRSTLTLGAASLIDVLFRIVRTKLLAVILGPSGIGVMGVFTSIVDFAQSLAGLGIQSSAVRQIAEAVGSENRDRIAVTTTLVRRVTAALGALGAVSVVVAARAISTFSFGDGRYAPSIALLAVAVFCRELSGGQSALVQGTRRIADLAKISIVGAALGTIATIPIAYVWGEDGIAASIVVSALFGLCVSLLQPRGHAGGSARLPH